MTEHGPILFAIIILSLIIFVICSTLLFVPKQGKAIIIDGIYIKIPSIGSKFRVIGESRIYIPVEIVEEKKGWL